MAITILESDVVQNLISFLDSNDVTYEQSRNSVSYEGYYNWYCISLIDLHRNENLRAIKRQVRNNIQH